MKLLFSSTSTSKCNTCRCFFGVVVASRLQLTLKQVKRRWSSRKSRGRSHFSHQALLECVSPSVCVVCMLETESVSSPEASHLNSVWKWASCQSSTRGCLGKWAIHQSDARLWGCGSLQYLTRHLHNASQRESGRDQGEERTTDGVGPEANTKRWKNNICGHQKEIQALFRKKEQIGRKA